ncbi:adenylate cyclase [Breoghania corrubedonensis]|uniref:Adenylate cyclase n=1 Tax=Breoghania corrubedonensis TaxID=665038 RepID=A0A2T5V5V5_9HYPH|nr:adenylate/guanylate cyclase domain-containing protein [Breoghania corrubedonensis]PTW59139.1 adenylate cyclase [Breoghania corrubedonensis]
MSHDALITSLEDWLVDEALGTPSIVQMYREVCEALFSIGVPVARSMLSWPTLHPLIEVEAAIWKKGQNVVLEQFAHRERKAEEWNLSPFKHLVESGSDVLRRRLAGPTAVVDFPLLQDMAGQGYTDYLAMITRFDSAASSSVGKKAGIIISWASDRAGGFTDSDILALRRIQRGFAVACRTAIQANITTNITETYLGKHAGREVLAGNIRRGDGATTRAVILYSDLRDSSTLAETLAGDEYLALLNDYFDCTAGSAIEAGGEVLDFIGDAVLAIFPLAEAEDNARAIRAASDAVNGAIERRVVVNAKRRKHGLHEIHFGLSASLGEVMFGNIGVPSRLSFSVVGPAVNAAARIEALTKDLHAMALATDTVAKFCPQSWQSIGPHRLKGMEHPVELYRWNEDAVASAAVA